MDDAVYLVVELFTVGVGLCLDGGDQSLSAVSRLPPSQALCSYSD